MVVVLEGGDYGVVLLVGDKEERVVGGGKGTDLGDGGEGVGGRVADGVGGYEEGSAGARGGGGGCGEGHREDYGGNRETAEERGHGEERERLEEICYGRIEERKEKEVN